MISALDLSRNELGDAAASHVARLLLSPRPRLRELRLASCGLSAKGLVTLRRALAKSCTLVVLELAVRLYAAPCVSWLRTQPVLLCFVPVCLTGVLPWLLVDTGRATRD